MANLLSCQAVSKTYGMAPLFSGISFGIGDRDRIGIIGPNGSGKSTLLKILAGLVHPDDGVIAVTKGTRLVYVAQQSEFDAKMTVEGAVKAVLIERRVDEGEHAAIVNTVLGRVGFEDNAQVINSLSGGWRKRLAIACALAQQPELLLLDEPTNHLDLAGILWLEKLLKSSPFACAVISHDRYFLENVATQTLELNRIYPGGLFQAAGAYSSFLEKKAEFVANQLQQQASLANKVRREVEWLRQGAKARTTKQQARIQAAEKLQADLSELNQRTRQGSVDIDFSASQRKTKKLVKLSDVAKALGGRTILQNLALNLSPGVRLGLLGANASGKSTILKVLAGTMTPDSGTVERADQLRVVYFDQNRESLDPAVTLRRALAPHGDSVVVNDRSLHVVSWAKKFLFRSEQLDVPVGKLSGGEQARVLIAQLMLQPADLLLLDEPTNDLDIPTLEVLEESLTEFPGAVVLVTHDRYMLDRVSNIILALDGSGGTQYYADYNQWQQNQPANAGKKWRADLDKVPSAEMPVQPAKSTSNKRLTYNEQREFDHMEKNISVAEAKLALCQKQIEDPKIGADSMRLQEAYGALKQAQDNIERLYTRWAELEQKIK